MTKPSDIFDAIEEGRVHELPEEAQELLRMAAQHGSTMSGSTVPMPPSPPTARDTSNAILRKAMGDAGFGENGDVRVGIALRGGAEFGGIIGDHYEATSDIHHLWDVRRNANIYFSLRDLVAAWALPPV